MIISGFVSKWKHFSFRIKSRKRKFAEIYSSGGFGGIDVPLSGSGSTLEQTNKIRQVLPRLFKRLMITSFVDASCGDFTWMKEVDLVGIHYIGADIVDELIRSNNQLYSSDHIKFINKDIVIDVLPPSDLILCRDCFIHLSNKDIKESIVNFKRSGATYLLTTTFQYIYENPSMVTGRGWRPINLVIAPFNFPPPLESIDEESTEEDAKIGKKSLGLWRLDSL